MADYKDANLIKAAVLACDHPELYDDFSERIFSFNDVLTMIDSVKSADVEEVRHGKWIDDPNGSTWVNGEKIPMKVCSVCGNANPFNALGDLYYPVRCDRCGAKMDGGKE